MTEHRDVAAYALGLLDDRAATHFEEHLIECDACAAELDSMVPVMEALAAVDPNALIDPPPAPVAAPLPRPGRARGRQWTLRPFIARHRLASRPRALAVATAFAAVLLLAVGGLIAGAQWTGGQPKQVNAGRTSATATPRAPLDTGGPGIGGELPAGKKFETTDPVTGVHALVVLESKAWGTQVSYALSHLKGPQKCRLTLVRSDGGSEAGSSWNVPLAGYGTDAQPQPLELQTATATPTRDLARVQVQSVAPNGVVTTLVEVPV